MNLKKLKCLIKIRNPLFVFLAPILMFFAFSICVFCTTGNISFSDSDYVGDELESTDECVDTDNYTVAFRYNGAECSLVGGESVKLDQVLKNLDITGKSIESAECSNNELFSVSQENGEWIISLHNYLQNEESLKVVVDGKIYNIVAIDGKCSYTPDRR